MVAKSGVAAIPNRTSEGCVLTESAGHGGVCDAAVVGAVAAMGDLAGSDCAGGGGCAAKEGGKGIAEQLQDLMCFSSTSHRVKGCRHKAQVGMPWSE